MKKFLYVIITAVCSFLFVTQVFAREAAFPGSYWWINGVQEWGYCADGDNLENGWYWIDGNHDGKAECYYFSDADLNNYGLITDTVTPDGYQVNAAGEWVKDGIVQTKPSSEIDSKFISYYAYDFGKATPHTPFDRIPLIDSGAPSNKSIGRYPKSSESNGWLTERRYYKENGSLYINEWAWIDNKCYYFNENGILLTDAVTPDGYQVNAAGEWVIDGAVQTEADFAAP